MTAGVPAVPVSTAYSLPSADTAGSGRSPRWSGPALCSRRTRTLLGGPGRCVPGTPMPDRITSVRALMSNPGRPADAALAARIRPALLGRVGRRGRQAGGHAIWDRGSTLICDQSFDAVSVATSRLVAKDRGSASARRTGRPMTPQPRASASRLERERPAELGLSHPRGRGQPGWPVQAGVRA